MPAKFTEVRLPAGLGWNTPALFSVPASIRFRLSLQPQCALTVAKENSAALEQSREKYEPPVPRQYPYSEEYVIQCNSQGNHYGEKHVDPEDVNALGLAGRLGYLLLKGSIDAPELPEDPRADEDLKKRIQAPSNRYDCNVHLRQQRAHDHQHQRAAVPTGQGHNEQYSTKRVQTRKG